MVRKPGLGFPVYVIVAIAVSGYFAFAAIQGELGVVTRVQATVELDRLTARRDELTARADQLANKTHRLSDQYLDLDLLGERARDVLGMARVDELVIR